MKKRSAVTLSTMLLCLSFLFSSCLPNRVTSVTSEEPTPTQTQPETQLQTTQPPTASPTIPTTAAPTVTKSSGTTTRTAAPTTGTTAAKSVQQRAEEIRNSMTLDERVGQMFIVRCPAANAAAAVAQYRFGGYILFSQDFKGKTPATVKAAIGSYQNASKVKMLIGVDEEGGTVNRVSLYSQFRSSPFASPQTLYAKGGWNSIVSDTMEKASLLKSLGINLNMAPVCDVSTNPGDYIYARSFGQNAPLTAEYAKKVVTAMNAAGIGCTLKHFPGYGNNVDTHTGISYDNRSYATFEQSDFLPFKSGIGAGAGSVLVSHNIVKCMDPNNPASLSPKVHQILRSTLGYTGVIMTDDLSMDAIKQYTKEDEAAVSAVLCGNDLVCCTDFATQVPAVLNAVKAGKITKARIDESVLRILEWKLRLGIIR